MLRDPIEAPRHLVKRLSEKYTLPSQMRCEVFHTGKDDLRALFCTAPITLDGERFAMLAVAGGTKQSREDLVRRLRELIQVSGLAIPRLEEVEVASDLLAVAAWGVKGELRALLASTVATYVVRSETAGAPLSALPPQLETSGIDHGRFKEDLLEFANACETGLQAMVRRALKSKLTRRWSFPLNCLIEEEVTVEGVTWRIFIEEIELAERAHYLVEQRLRKAQNIKSNLFIDHSQYSQDEMATVMPTAAVGAKSNSYKVRVEMARLLRNLLAELGKTEMRKAA